MSILKIDSLVERVRRKGLGNTVRRVIRIAFSHVYVKQRLYLIVHDLGRELPPVELPEGYTCGYIEGSDLGLLVPLVGKRRVSSYRRRLETGMLCYAVRKGATVTNFFWCSAHDVVDDILGIRIPVEDGEAYSFDAFTRVEYRHRGLFVSLLAFHLHDLREKGFTRILGCHNPGDLGFVYPKYRETGIPVRIERVVDFRKILFVRDVHWSHFNGRISQN